jgi:hypothetical protein
VILTYRHRSGPSGEWKEVRVPVALTWTECNFGGERPWFFCPGAGCCRRVAILYGPGRYFLCSHCYDLVYESQRDNGMYRALHKHHEAEMEQLIGMREWLDKLEKKVGKRTAYRFVWQIQV